MALFLLKLVSGESTCGIICSKMSFVIIFSVVTSVVTWFMLMNLFIPRIRIRGMTNVFVVDKIVVKLGKILIPLTIESPVCCEMESTFTQWTLKKVSG